MTKEKKKTIIVTVALIIVAVVLLASFTYVTLRQNGKIGSQESNEIMKDFDKYFNSNDREIIYYASSECSYCSLQTPILETIAEDYDLDYLYVNSAELSSKQRNEVLDTLSIEHATPTTVIVEDGKVIATQVGYIDGNGLVEFFIENKILDDDAIYSAEKNITFIDYTKYSRLIKKDDLSIIVIGQSTCSHCIAIKPALNEIAGEYDITINYLNLTDMTDDEKNSFYESLEEIEYNDPDFLEDGSFGTPLTLIVENKKVKDYISGERTISQLVREFKKNGIISE